MPPIHNHYVPAYYLNGFVNPTSKKIFMYRKETNSAIETTIQSVANELHYWSAETEIYLANKVENPANPVIEKIRARAPIDSCEKWMLARYVIAMLKRVPDGRDRILARSPAVMKRTLDGLRSQLETEKKANPAVRDRVDSILKQLDDLSPEFIAKIPNQVWEDILAPEKTSESLRKLNEMRWVFLTSGKDRGFVSSDNPAIYTRANGIRPPAGELIFPISTEVALWANWSTEWIEGRYYAASRKMVDEVNYWIAFCASDYLFYSGHKDWIHALIKKITRKSKKNSNAPSPRPLPRHPV